MTEGIFNEQHARALAKTGIDITVVVCKPWLPHLLAKVWRRYSVLLNLPQNEQRNGIKILYARYLHIPGYLWPQTTVLSCARSVLHSIRNLGKKGSFDIVQVHGTWPVGLAAPIISDALGSPFVLTSHIQDEERLYNSPTGLNLYRNMLERAATIIAVGRPLELFLRRFIPKSNGKPLIRIPNGIDHDSIDRAVRAIEPIERSWGYIVSVSNLWPTKGIDLNLRALSNLELQGVPWQAYTVVGEGPERKRLMRLSQDLGIAHKVYFTGRLSHGEALLEITKHDIFTLPSWQEAFGVAYLEAMALGKPVIGCSGQGAEDIIRHEHDGLLVRSRDVKDLAHAVKRLLESPVFSRELGMAGKLRAQEFTWGNNAEQYRKVYERVRSCSPASNRQEKASQPHRAQRKD